VPLPPVVGNYQPLLQLAVGGMATVYAVRLVGARGFERVVVMKRVHPHLLDNREFREMFIDEARISSLIKHPNIVPVIDVVEESGELFLIMEYVESVSLAQLLKAAGDERLAPRVVSRIVHDVASGLHAAHEATDLRGEPMSIVHRDVSPQNIVVGVDGTSRLIDFGIAKAASRLTPTTTGAIKGKFSYMSPEQIRQQVVDRRADVFSAGVVLHEALTATRLFKGDDDAATLLMVMVAHVPDPSSIVPGLPAELDAVVHGALALDREDRFPTASDFAWALERACPPASPREVAELVARLSGEQLGARQRTLRAAFERQTPAPIEAPPEAKRRRTIVGAGAVFGVVAVGALAIVGARSMRASSVAPAASMPGAPVATAPIAPANVDSVVPAASYRVPPVASAPPVASTSHRPPRSAATAKPPAPNIHLHNPYLGPGAP
jgi:serine/threonine protein kinase